MGWMSQLRLQQLTGWQAAGDGRGSATLELVRERGRWWSMSRCGRGEVPEAAGAQDRTGLVGRASQPGKVSVRSVCCQFSTRFSARKLGKYVGQQQVSRYLPGRPGSRQHRASSAQSPRAVTERPGPGLPRCGARCCVGYEDSTIETGPAHWLQGCFDVRLSQPKLGWDADSVRKALSRSTALQLLVCLLAPFSPLCKQVVPTRAITAVCPCTWLRGHVCRCHSGLCGPR